MINIKELMLGNYLMHGSKIVSVSAIFKSHFNAEDTAGIDRNSVQARMLPIPLTPEILEKCGFEIKENDLWNNGMGNSVFINLVDQTVRMGYGLSIGTIFPIISSKIKYLHQLQNLYFALTGEELPITL